MPPNSRQPSVRSVRTPAALTALRGWLGTFPAEKREEGGDYYRKKAVKEVWSEADHLVKASLDIGSEMLAITLFLTRGAWTSRCSCPVLDRCEHVYAAGLAWLAAVESGQLDGRRPTIPLLPADRAPGAATPAVPSAPCPRRVNVPPRKTPVRCVRSRACACASRPTASGSSRFASAMKRAGSRRPSACSPISPPRAPPISSISHPPRPHSAPPSPRNAASMPAHSRPGCRFPRKPSSASCAPPPPAARLCCPTAVRLSCN